MTRALARVMLLAIAASGLPGCIALFGGDTRSRVETPTGEKLTNLEQRMDRIDARLPKNAQ